MATSTKGKSGSFTNFVSSIVQTVKNAFVPSSQKASYNLDTGVASAGTSSGSSSSSSGTSSGSTSGSSGSGTSGTSGGGNKRSGGGGGGGTSPGLSGGYSTVDKETGKAFEFSPEGVKKEITYRPSQSNSNKNLGFSGKVEESFEGTPQATRFIVENKEVGRIDYEKPKVYERGGYRVEESSGRQPTAQVFKPATLVFDDQVGREAIVLSDVGIQKSFYMSSPLTSDEQSIAQSPLSDRDLSEFNYNSNLDFGNNSAWFNSNASNRFVSRSNFNRGNFSSGLYNQGNNSTDENFLQKISEFLDYNSKDNPVRKLIGEENIPKFYVDVPDVSNIIGFNFFPSGMLKFIPDENDISVFELAEKAGENYSELPTIKRELILSEIKNIEKGNVANGTWTGNQESYDAYLTKFSQYEDINVQVKSRSDIQQIQELGLKLFYGSAKYIPTDLLGGAILAGEIYAGTKALQAVGAGYAWATKTMPAFMYSTDIALGGITTSEGVKTFADPTADIEQKLAAGLNIGLAVIPYSIAGIKALRTRSQIKALSEATPEISLGVAGYADDALNLKIVARKQTNKLSSTSIYDLDVLENLQIVRGKGTTTIVNKKGAFVAGDDFTFFGSGQKAVANRFVEKYFLMPDINNLIDNDLLKATKRVTLPNEAVTGSVTALNKELQKLDINFAGIGKQVGSFTEVIYGNVNKGRYYKTGETGIDIDLRGGLPIEYDVYEDVLRGKIDVKGIGLIKNVDQLPGIRITQLPVSDSMDDLFKRFGLEELEDINLLTKQKTPFSQTLGSISPTGNVVDSVDNLQQIIKVDRKAQAEIGLSSILSLDEELIAAIKPGTKSVPILPKLMPQTDKELIKISEPQREINYVSSYHSIVQKDVARNRSRQREIQQPGQIPREFLIDDLSFSQDQSQRQRVRQLQRQQFRQQAVPAFPFFPDIPYQPKRRIISRGKKKIRWQEDLPDFALKDTLTTSQDFTAKILGYKPIKVKSEREALRAIQNLNPFSIRRGLVR